MLVVTEVVYKKIETHECMYACQGKHDYTLYATFSEKGLVL